MNVSLATPDKRIYSGTAEAVHVVAAQGELDILDRHANLVSLVRPGPVTIRTAQGNKTFSVSEGLLKVEDNRVSLLCRDIVAA